MLDYNTMGACVLVLTLVSVFMMVILIRKQRTGKDITVWLMSGLTGILLGAGGAAAAIQLLGYEVTERFVMPEGASLGMLAELDSDQLMGSGGGEGGDTESESGGPPAGMGMMMGMGGGGGGAGARGPSPKRELTTLVRKVDLLTGDVALSLSADQTTALGEILVRIQAQESMTDDQATAAHEEILALLDESQKAKQDAIGLPFGRSGGRGGRGGRGGPGGGEAAQEDANPFADEQNALALQSLLERIGSGDSSSPTPQAGVEETPAPETPAEADSTEATTEEPAEPDEPAEEADAADSPTAEEDAVDSATEGTDAAEPPPEEAEEAEPVTEQAGDEAP